MKAIRGLIKFAHARNLIDRDPAAGYELPDGTSEPIEIFTPEEVRLIFDDPRPGMTNAWTFLTQTALRIGEFCWLMKSDVVIGAAGMPTSILIRPKTCPSSGVAWHPKHRLSREVPLCPSASAIAATMLTTGDGPWLFSRLTPAAPNHGRWRTATLRDLFIRRLIRCGIRHGHPHVLRHTFASYLVNVVGMSLVQVQSFLGHRDLKSTAQYLHTSVREISQVLWKADFSLLQAIPTTTEAAACGATSAQSSDLPRIASPAAVESSAPPACQEISAPPAK
jgi:integrase